MKVSCNQEGIDVAVESVLNGGVIVFPTDTVYGVGCDPYNKEAVNKIYKIKNRKHGKSFPILGYSKDELAKIVVFDQKSAKIADRFWPGQVTLVLRLTDARIKETIRVKDKVAVRVPDNECIQKILKKCKFLVGTSANISGSGSLLDANSCQDSITGYDVLVDGGTIKGHGESTIVEVAYSKIIFHRIGAISKEEIMNIF